jgi:PAS domain S-box-containing protein
LPWLCLSNYFEIEKNSLQKEIFIFLNELFFFHFNWTIGKTNPLNYPHMDKSIVIGLLQNTAILLAFSMLYENMWMKKEDTRKFSKKVLTGLVLGAIGIVIMYTPWQLSPGIVFDTRSVMLSISGLFFGAVPTSIAMIFTGTLRVIQGGGGMWMGLAVIISAGTIGILWRQLRPEWKQKNYKIELLSLGFVVHLVMALSTMLLPEGRMLVTLKAIALPLLFIYTPATLLLGLLMVKQANNWKNRLAKEKLRESERRFNQLLESGNILTVILDRNGNINFCNNYLLEITQYEYHELKGQNWFETFIPVDSREKLKSIFDKILINKETTRNFESPIIAKNGEIRYISWFSISLRSDKAENRGLASIGVNITEHKHFEIRLKEKNDEIETQNEELIQTNKELLLAKQKAEESDHLKTAFLQNMSHEIRTPMNAVIGFSGLLNKPLLNEEKRKSYTSIIVVSAKQLLSIVDDILTISSLDAKQEKLKITSFSLNHVLDNLYIIYKPQADGKKVSMVYKKALSDHESEIQGDKTKITQILSNLLNNALKFTSVGGIEFGYIIETSKNPKVIRLYVKDSGIGIYPEMQEKVFERFVQADLSISKQFGGTGLGLAISKAFAELMNGKIWVESEPGKGSAFYLNIPFVSAYRDQNFDPPVPLTFPGQSSILVADDEEYSFMIVEELFYDLKIKIIRARNGREAVEICKADPSIKLVLMDIKMPLLNGHEAAQIIKGFNAKLPIIAQTAYDLDSDIYSFRDTTFDDFIQKPINENELKLKLQKYL